MTIAPQSLFFGNTMKIIRVKQVFYVLSLLFLSIPSIAFSQGPTQRITIAVLEFEGNGVPDQTMQDVSARFATEYAAFKGSQFNIQWNGKDEYGNQLSTGVYIYSLESAEFRQAKKLILLK